MTGHDARPVIEFSVPHPARRYDYWLGGKDNFAADRESADPIEATFPGMRAGIRAGRDELPSGSYLAATHVTVDAMPAEQQARYQQLLEAGGSDIWPRDREAFAAVFDGLDLVEPGIELIGRWRPDAGTADVDPSRISIWGAVARRP